MSAPAQPGSVVIPGNFDGVHLGHRALVAQARALAAEHAGRPSAAPLRVAALTFDPHPLALLAPDRAPPALCTIDRRVALLERAGCDDVHVARFDASFAAQSPEQFVERVLVGGASARVVIVGDDFRFGARRAGDLALLRALGQAHGFDVARVDAVLAGAERVSSSRVRQAVAAGEVVAAAGLLGRLHEVEGQVVRGDQRGRALGFPTANLRVDPVLLPADGVYSVLARVVAPPASAPPHPAPGPGDLLRGVANLGVRPTFGAGRSVEVHLLGFDGDLYGARLRVAFAGRVRGERKFAGVDALRAQIADDVAAARDQLASVPAEWTEAI
jgi:riboflavin kinase/FMN adenylyltransferase